MVGVQRIEPVLPPQRRAPAACPSPGRPAARCGRRTGRRTAAAARSSPSGASAAGHVDLPAVLEAEQPLEQVAVPGERVERRDERHARLAAGRPRRRARGRLARDLELRRVQHRQLVGDDEPLAPQALDRDRRDRPRLDQLVAQRPRRSVVLPMPVQQRVLPRRAEQPVAAVPRQQLVAVLLVARAAGARAGRPGTGARSGRRRAGCPRGATIAMIPASASASSSARTWLVGRQYQSIASRGSTSVDDSGPLVADPLEQLLDERRVLVERAAAVRLVAAVPRDPVPRQLGRRHDREHLVVRLVQRAVAVQELVRPGAPVAVDARQQRQVVVAAGDVDRVELQRPEAVDDAHHRRRLGRQRPRRREEVAGDEEPPRDGGETGTLGSELTDSDRTGRAARSCHVPAAAGDPPRRPDARRRRIGRRPAAVVGSSGPSGASSVDRRHAPAARSRTRSPRSARRGTCPRIARDRAADRDGQQHDRRVEAERPCCRRSGRRRCPGSRLNTIVYTNMITMSAVVPTATATEERERGRDERADVRDEAAEEGQHRDRDRERQAEDDHDQRARHGAEQRDRRGPDHVAGQDVDRRGRRRRRGARAGPRAGGR